MKTVKIVAISDTHNKHHKIKIPECDILIHAGDMTSMGYYREIKEFFEWFKLQPAKHHVCVMGNHELKFEEMLPLSKTWIYETFPEVHVLFDETIELEGLKIHGSPITPNFFNWAFNRARGEDIKRHWDLIPEDTDVLITHGPPYGILDELLFIDGRPKGVFVGCEMLLEKVKIVRPDVHVFGHIHCGAGEKHIDGTSFYNASMLDEMYSLVNDPKVIEVIIED